MEAEKFHLITLYFAVDDKQGILLLTLMLHFKCPILSCFKDFSSWIRICFEDLWESSTIHRTTLARHKLNNFMWKFLSKSEDGKKKGVKRCYWFLSVHGRGGNGSNYFYLCVPKPHNNFLPLFLQSKKNFPIVHTPPEKNRYYNM